MRKASAVEAAPSAAPCAVAAASRSGLIGVMQRGFVRGEIGLRCRRCIPSDLIDTTTTTRRKWSRLDRAIGKGDYQIVSRERHATP